MSVYSMYNGAGVKAGQILGNWGASNEFRVEDPVAFSLLPDDFQLYKESGIKREPISMGMLRTSLRQSNIQVVPNVIVLKPMDESRLIGETLQLLAKCQREILTPSIFDPIEMESELDSALTKYISAPEVGNIRDFFDHLSYLIQESWIDWQRLHDRVTEIHKKWMTR